MHIIESINLVGRVEEGLAVVIAGDREYLAAQHFLDDLVHFDRALVHFLFAVVQLLVVAVGSVSAHEAVVKLGLGVVVQIDPVAQLSQCLHVEVDVCQEDNLESFSLV